jgi:hypothetical protein
VSLDKRVITFLLKLVQERPKTRAAGEVAMTLYQHYSIGIRGGMKILYQSGDYARAAILLKENNISPDTPSDAWSQGDRTEAAAHRGKEKWSGQTASQGLVAIKALPGRALCVNGVSLYLPDGAHLVVPFAMAQGNGSGAGAHTSIIVVENLVPFRRAHLWHSAHVARCGDNPMLIYRGDTGGTRADTVNSLLSACHLPVFGAFDLDPAGLGMSLSLPRLDGFLAPGADVVDAYLTRMDENKGQSLGQSDLYAKQYGQWAPKLDEATHAEIAGHWQVIRRHGQGLIQEWFLELGVLAHDF